MLLLTGFAGAPVQKNPEVYRTELVARATTEINATAVCQAFCCNDPSMPASTAGVDAFKLRLTQKNRLIKTQFATARQVHDLIPPARHLLQQQSGNRADESELINNQA